MDTCSWITIARNAKDGRRERHGEHSFGFSGPSFSLSWTKQKRNGEHGNYDIASALIIALLCNWDWRWRCRRLYLERVSERWEAACRREWERETFDRIVYGKTSFLCASLIVVLALVFIFVRLGATRWQPEYAYVKIV